jgi:hypothetical protein
MARSQARALRAGAAPMIRSLPLAHLGTLSRSGDRRRAQLHAVRHGARCGNIIEASE